MPFWLCSHWLNFTDHVSNQTALYSKIGTKCAKFLAHVQNKLIASEDTNFLDRYKRSWSQQSKAAERLRKHSTTKIKFVVERRCEGLLYFVIFDGRSTTDPTEVPIFRSYEGHLMIWADILQRNHMKTILRVGYVVRCSLGASKLRNSATTTGQQTNVIMD